MGLETDGAAIAVAVQRGQLPSPIHAHLAERAPDRFVVLHDAVLGVHVDDPGFRECRIAVRERGLSEDKRVRRIPNEFEGGMIDLNMSRIMSALMAGSPSLRGLIFPSLRTSGGMLTDRCRSDALTSAMA